MPVRSVRIHAHRPDWHPKFTHALDWFYQDRAVVVCTCSQLHKTETWKPQRVSDFVMAINLLSEMVDVESKLSSL